MGLFDNNEDNSYDMLNETYYGKNPLLLKNEENFKLLKEDFLKTNNNINNNSEVITDICKNFAKLFGFEKAYFKVVAEERYMNAFTIPFFIKESYAKDNKFFDVERSQYGIRYKKPEGKILYIYVNSYLFRNCSTDNIMAIILHEIGHNFFLIKEQVNNANLHLGIDNNLAMLKYLNNNGWSPVAIKNASNYMYEMVNYLDDAQLETLKAMKNKLNDKANKQSVESYKISRNIFVRATKIITKFITSSITGVFNLMVILLLPIYLYNMQNDKLVLKKRVEKEQAYNAEKFSDSFAASYGYGKNVADTFNSTMSLDATMYSKIPLLRIHTEFDRTLTYFFAYYSDEHPDDYTRVLDSLNKLKYELRNNKDSLDARQIAEIEQSISDIEEILKKTPLYKKIIRKLFNPIRKNRNLVGNKGLSDADIFDFENYILSDNIQNN